MYGQSGTGKTTFAATFPDPILWLVCSGGNRPGELKSIDTPANRARITPKIIHDTAAVREYLREAGDYATVVLDHATGLADLILKELLHVEELPAQKGWGLASQQQWGQVALQCKEYFRAMLNLPNHVVILAQERTFGGKDDGLDPELVRPVVGAALTPSVTGWLNPACDYVVQTYKRPRTEVITTVVAGKTLRTTQRVKGLDFCLRVEPHDVYTTKFRLPGGVQIDAIPNPSYDKVLALVEGRYAPEGETGTAAK